MIAVVTGAAGFIGSTLSHRLLSEGATVLGIDSLTRAYDIQQKVANIDRLMDHDGFHLYYADLVDADLDPILRDADVVFHLAGQASVRGSWGTTFDHYAHNNIAATQVLLESCERTGIDRVVYASSSSIYGNPSVTPTPETALPQPISPYGVSKLAAEHLCRTYTLERGVPTTSLRLFTVYGPGQRPDMCFRRLVDAAVRGERFVVNGDGSVIRDFTYVDDVVDAFVRAGSAGWDGVVNIGGGHPVRLGEVLDIVEEMTGPIDIEFGAPLAGDADVTAADVGLAASILGYAPQVDLRQGLRAMLAWADPRLESSVA